MIEQELRTVLYLRSRGNGDDIEQIIRAAGWDIQATIDTAAAVLTTSYLNFGSEHDYVFAINTHLMMGNTTEFRAYFLLLPDDASLKGMLQALRLG